MHLCALTCSICNIDIDKHACSTEYGSHVLTVAAQSHAAMLFLTLLMHVLLMHV
jgi:hypothetical protein